MPARDLLDLSSLPKPTGVGPDGHVPPTDPAEDEAVSPEEQAQYEQFVVKAMQFIHGEKTRDSILDHLNQTDLSVPEAVGRTAAFIVRTVAGVAKAQDVELDPNVIFHAGREIVEELMLTGSKAGILPIDFPEEEDAELPPETEQLVEQAFAVGAHEYGKEMVQTEEGKALAPDAADFYARQVAKEADAGTLSPEFAKQFGRRDTPVAHGVRRALVQE